MQMNHFQSQIYQKESLKSINNNNLYLPNHPNDCVEYCSPALANNRPISQKGEENKSEPLSINHQKTKTLVLDLDETLIHSSPFPVNKVDAIKTIEIEGMKCNIYIKKRPGLDEFISKVSEFYKLAVFTASERDYATIVINYIDPNHHIKQKLYREHCTIKYFGAVKNLNKFKANLKNIILLDNTPSTYSMQPANGLPIPSWTGNSSDDHLYRIGNILEKLSEVDDVRVYIPQIVRNFRVLYAKASSILSSISQTKKPENNVEKTPAPLNKEKDSVVSPNQKESKNDEIDTNQVNFLSPSYIRDHTGLISTQKIKMTPNKASPQKMSIQENKKNPKKRISSNLNEDHLIYKYNQTNNINKTGLKKQNNLRKSTADPDLRSELFNTKNKQFQYDSKVKFTNDFTKNIHEMGLQNLNIDYLGENSKILMKNISKEKVFNTPHSNKLPKKDNTNLNSFSKIMERFNNSNYIPYSEQFKRKDHK